MRLFLIRHGQTPWTVAKRYQGITDVPLDPRGVRQAKAIATALRAHKPKYLYTSTLQRARETAKWVGRQLGTRPIADSRLNELHFGKWEGASYRRLNSEGGKTFERWRQGRLRKPPGGESISSLSRRVGQVFEEILERHFSDTVAIVSHGGPIKMFLFKALKTKTLSIWSFRIDPGSISLIEGDRELLQIVWLNRTDHLSSR